MIAFSKYLLTIFIFLVSAQYSFSQNEASFYEINGVIAGLGNRKVILGNKPNAYTHAFKIKYFDSCYSKNDSFYFRGSIDEPNWVSIEVEGIPGSRSFILENSIVSFKGELIDNKFGKVVVKGSSEQDFLNNFNRRLYPLRRNQELLWEEYDLAMKNSDSSNMKKWRDSANFYWTLIIDTTLDFIRYHPENFASLYGLDNYLSLINADSAKNAFLSLSPGLQNHSTGKDLKYKLFELANKIKVNNQVPNFILKDTSGKSIPLNSIQANYILLDFWASWCGPCIAQFDHLKVLDKKYQHKGLKIIGINIDTKEKLWKNAVKQHKIPWLTLSDLNGDESEPYKIFNIREIPTLYLLDSNYNLLALEIKGDQLDELLENYFKD